MNLSKHHDKDIILASESKRRIQLLEELKIPFKSVPSKYKELIFNESDKGPAEFALLNAQNKAEDVAANVANALVIGMDTIGEYEGRVFEKPDNREHAKEMIKALNGTTHNVITGICIIDADSGDMVNAAEITKVTFTHLSDNEIEAYLDKGEWRGLACGYGIQGIGALFIEQVEGDYFNVVGFPIHRFYHLMKEIGMNLLEVMP
jgi:nucleoside triphosphate pyrophosphatase